MKGKLWRDDEFQPADELIMACCSPEPNSGCWLWFHTVSNGGYGKVRHKKKLWYAHRLSYTTFKGEIPNGKMICHKCNNSVCVNPDHLYVGTNVENTADRIKIGTHNFGPGHRYYGGNKE